MISRGSAVLSFLDVSCPSYLQSLLSPLILYCKLSSVSWIQNYLLSELFPKLQSLLNHLGGLHQGIATHVESSLSSGFVFQHIAIWSKTKVSQEADDCEEFAWFKPFSQMITNLNPALETRRHVLQIF